MFFTYSLTQEMFMKRIIIFSMICCLAFAAGVRGADWPNWRGPAFNGVSTETEWSSDWPANGPVILWRANAGVGFSSMAVVDGRVYTMGNTGGQNKNKETQQDVVYCFSAGNGELIWKYAYKHVLEPKYYEGGTSATPTVNGGRVYTLSKHGHALCLDAVNGRVIWEHDLVKEHNFRIPTWGFAGSVVVLGDLLLINAGTHGIALKSADGSLLWSTGTEKAGYSTPVVYETGGSRMMAVLGEESFAGVETAGGRVAWTIPWKASHDENIADPVIVGDWIFLSTHLASRASLFKVDGDNITEIWHNKNLLSWMNTPVVLKDHMYGINARNKSLQCMKIDDGSKIWEEKGFGQGQIMMAGDRIIAIKENGTLVVARATPEQYQELASASIMKNKCWTVPVLSGGRIYVRDAMGDLVCLDVAK